MSVLEAELGGERQGAADYIDAIRGHLLLIVALVVLAVAAAATYSLTASKRYEAEADLVVTPLSSNDETFVGIPSLLRDNGRGRAIATAARFVRSPQVADEVKNRVGTSRSTRQALLDSITVRPVSQSNILTIVGKSSDPARAAQIANAFADATVGQRSGIFQAQLQSVIRGLKRQYAAIPGAQKPLTGAAIQQRLAQLEPLVGKTDPSIQLSSTAVRPETAVWPRPVRSIAVAFLAALMLGVAIALALELVTPRVNREEELRREQRLPILARVPKLRDRLVRDYLTGREPLPVSLREAYRKLCARLTSSPGGVANSILVTSAVPGEGKTMTSVNLAVGLAATPGTRVILVDADPRGPIVSTLFGVSAGRHRGLVDVLSGEATLAEALLPAPGHGDSLRLLLASPEHAQLVDLLDPERVEQVVTELRLAADVVIFDSPPLTEVVDALTLAEEVEAVIIAVRLGRTRRDRLNELRRLLAQRRVTPLGFVVTTKKRWRGDDNDDHEEQREEAPPGNARRGRDRDAGAAPAENGREVRRRPPAFVPGEGDGF